MTTDSQLANRGPRLSSASAIDRHKQILAYGDAIFGGYCLVLAAAALWAWTRGQGSLRSVAILIGFIIVNITISILSKRLSQPQSAEIIRALAGLIITPLAYLLMTDPFDRWWPAFLIMALGGALVWGFLTIKPHTGRLLVIYYLALYFIAELLRGSPHNWYMILATAGGIAIAGLILAEVVSLLGMALESERTQKEQLEATNHSLEQQIAERKRIEESLRRSEERYRAVTQSAYDAIISADSHDRIISWNQGAEQIFQYTADEIIGQPISMIMPERYRAGHEEGMRRVAGGGPQHLVGRALEAHGLRKDGLEFDIELSFAMWEVNQERFFTTIARDISQRKRVEAELKAAKQAAELALAEGRRLGALIESATDYIGIADLQGWSIYVNQAGREMVGKPEHDEEPWNIANCYPAHVEDKLLDMMETVLGGKAWSGEIVLQHEEGHEIPVSEVTFLLPDDEGKPEYIGTIIHDISTLKQTESELKQAKEAAEAANKAKSTFLANMSHEIRTPMNAVIGMTGLLLNTPLDAKQRDFVETIRSAGDSLLTIINDILDFSKIEASKLELERYPLDLRACIESALDLMAPRAAEKGLELLYQMDEETPAGILGDVTRLRQILVNLLSNAIKFTDQGEVVVTLTSRRPPTKPNSRSKKELYQLQFSVRDTGIGIAPERMSRLFRSFSQLDASTTREYGGTGLGLAISKRLVELMGGRMTVESEGLGQGTTFHFTLTTEAAAVPVRSHLSNPRPELRGKRVLVVDDNKTNRHILCLQAETWGMIPQCVASPSEALAVLSQAEPFDLAILDMYLPEMDGLNLAIAIRQHPGRETLPLVMLTSVNRAKTALEAEAAGFAAFLTKPVKPSQLYDVLIGILAGQLESEAHTTPATPAEKGWRLAARLPLRILLVEDVAVNQKFALQALEQIGYKADVAGNGLEALRAVGRQPYDVILMDVQMPEMDGLEATRRIHQQWAESDPASLPISKRPHIIAMTANALQGDREMCLAAGMDDYISKPVYLEELYAALERATPADIQLLPLPEPVKPAATGNDRAIDQEMLAKILKRATGREVITLYLEESAGLVAAAQAAVAAGDAAALTQATHSLKGSSGYVGAQRLVALSSELEKIGRTGRTEPAASIVAELEAEFERVRQELAAA
jgi:PAS domain S-box-containing protein